MDEIPITALRIRAVSYENQTLHIRFKNGIVYQHRRVPEVIFRRFITAPSADAWYEKHIKNKFPYQKRSSL